jgi:hypothetical protein
VTGPSRCIAQVENALNGSLTDILLLSMTYDEFPNLDDLSMLLNHFPNLKKLALNSISEGEVPDVVINHTRTKGAHQRTLSESHIDWNSSR